jgi:hypothetical protein
MRLDVSSPIDEGMKACQDLSQTTRR